MNYLRRIKGITRRDRVRNEMMKQELKVEPMLKKIHKQQLKWFEQLMRVDNSRRGKKVWQAIMTGKTKEETWKNTIADIIKGKNVRGMKQIRRCETR